MFIHLITTLLILTGIQTTHSLIQPHITQELVERINRYQDSWTSGPSEYFAHHSTQMIADLCGTFISDETTLPPNTYPFFRSPIQESFDARTAWPECPVIGVPRDQANCGSCWAFASTEAFNDRLCIATNGSFQKILSPQDTVSCCGFLNCMSMGCNGGQPAAAWKFFQTTGVVTGGGYDDIGSGESCLPYGFQSCAHHVTDSSRPSCEDAKKGNTKCTAVCSESNYNTSYTDDKYHLDRSYGLHTVEEIQTDIQRFGPVTAAFTVYADFPTYHSGVYHHTTGSQLGGHAVKIIGWGTESGEDYWLVMNSWNENWGDGGTFKIRRGTDECGIESMGVNGGTVRTSSLKVLD